MIDLRSDTVTQPGPAMREAMMQAPLGDDVFGEDPTVNRVQERVADLFGHEAALFCPSGTMTNQAAIRVHTRPGDEVICAEVAHIYLYEGGGIASNSGASVRLVEGDRGRLSAQDVLSSINADESYLARTSLVSLEDTVNKGGGCCYELSEIQAIQRVCADHGLGFHMDGARVFNATVAKGHDTREYGKLFDSISVCFSKGLGCPVGSMLIGSKPFIHHAHRVRKSFGGGMRQAGMLAAAMDYALDHHIPLLQEDHRRAASLAETILTRPEVGAVLPVETNIVIFTLHKKGSSGTWVDQAAAHGLQTVPFGPDMVRMVTHMDFDDAQLARAQRIIEEMPRST